MGLTYLKHKAVKIILYTERSIISLLLENLPAVLIMLLLTTPGKFIMINWLSLWTHWCINENHSWIKIFPTLLHREVFFFFVDFFVAVYLFFGFYVCFHFWSCAGNPFLRRNPWLGQRKHIFLTYSYTWFEGSSFSQVTSLN